MTERERVEKAANAVYLDSDLPLLDESDTIVPAMVDFALAQRREQREEDAKIAEQYPDTLESVGEPGSGKFRAISKVAAAIRGQKE
jgi:hypothetical protein